MGFVLGTTLKSKHCFYEINDHHMKVVSNLEASWKKRREFQLRGTLNNQNID